MCGGRDLVKQDGLYVCQNCGCKYSTEEAKKLFEITGKVEVDGISTCEQLLERGNTYLKLEDYKSAQDTFKEFINTYPEKRVGYEKYIITISRNFKRDFVLSGSISDLNNTIKKLKKIDGDCDTSEAKDFLEKVDKYLNWLELTKQLHNKNDELSQVKKRTAQLSNQISNNKSNNAYIIAASIIFFIFGFIMFAAELNIIAVLSFILGMFMFVTIAISNNENKNASQTIDDNSIETRQIEKEIEDLNNQINKIKIN